jgi:hypothetical protein
VIGECTRDIFKGDAAVSQQTSRSAAIKCDDAGLNANLGCLAEEHGVNAPIELLQHMVGGSGREATEAIRTRRSDRRPCRANEGECHLVSWQAHANGIEPGAHQARNLGSRRGNNRERTRPEGICKKFDAWVGERSLGEEVGQVGAIGDVHDERIKGRATLRLKDACDRWRIERVRSKAVDSFGGEGDKTASPNDCRGARHGFRGGVCGACAQAFGNHAGRATSIISAA